MKDLFEIVAKASKPLPFQNLTEEQAQEICDVLYKSSLEMAIAGLRSGLKMANTMNNLLLAELIEKDLMTFLEMYAERELNK